MIMSQDNFDYSSCRGIPEIQIRVELLHRRLQTESISKDSNVLEVGLGSGDLTRMLATYFLNLTCLDIEQSRLTEVAEYLQKFPDVNMPKFNCGAAEDAKFPKRTFDNIILFGLLEHCEDGAEVLKNLKLSLKRNGRIHILVNNAGSIHRWLGVELGIIDDVADLSESDIKLGHYRVYTVDTLSSELDQAGLKARYTDLHYLKPLPTTMMSAVEMDLHQAFCRLGRRFPELSSYIYLEAAI